MWVIELLKNKSGKWFHRLKSGNGRIVYIAPGDGFKRKQSAEKIARTIVNEMYNSRFEDCGH